MKVFSCTRMTTAVSSCLIAYALTFSVSAFAAADTDLAVDDEFIVSATRSASVDLPVATDIAVITQEDIEISGVQKLSDLLRTQAGLQIQDLDGSGGRNVTIGTRGFSSNAANNTLVLVDGRKLNNPTLATANLNSVSLRDIERIEIFRGSAGVLFGDQAVGGVINIITKKHDSEDLSGNLIIGAGNLATRSVSGAIGKRLESGLGFRISIDHRQSDNFRDNNESDVTSYLVNLNYAFDNAELFIESQRINDNLRLPGALSEAQVAQNPEQTNTPDDFSDNRSRIQRLGGSIQLAEGWRLLGEYSTRKEEVEGFAFGSAREQETKVDNFSPRIVGNFAMPAGKATLTAGLDWVKSDFSRAFVDSEQRINAQYLQFVYLLDQGVTLSLGARSSEVEDTNVLAKSSQEDELEAFEAGLSYAATEKLRLFARYADAFRFANIDENGFTLPTVEFLRPQKSESYEGGIEWRGDSVDAKLSYYQMDLVDELAYDSGVVVPGSIFTGANVNLPKSERDGVLMDLEYRLQNDITLRLNYAYIDATTVSGSFAGNAVPYVAEHSANAALIYQVSDNWSLFVDADYTGDRYRISDDANAAGKLGSYTLVNINVGWQKAQWRANLRVNNIADRDYANFESVFGVYPQPGTNGSLTVGYDF